MGRFLNVGVIQMPVAADTTENLRYLQEQLDHLMSTYHRPELVVGVECLQTYTPEPLDGPVSDFFADLARQYGIYFIPGTVYEENEALPSGFCYNSAPVYNPQGERIAVYRKMAPWRPSEAYAAPGREYVVFEIPEKQTKIGIQICYDLNFPEISRNETLMGAEVLVKLTMDPQELYELNKHLHYTRALENQAYLVCTNCVGVFDGFDTYGHSQVISPEGDLIWEAGSAPSIATVTLDLDLVERVRNYGTRFMDHYLAHLGEYAFPMPYSDDVKAAPVFETIDSAPKTPDEYERRNRRIGLQTIGRRQEPQPDPERIRKNLDAFLKEKRKPNPCIE